MPFPCISLVSLSESKSAAYIAVPIVLLLFVLTVLLYKRHLNQKKWDSAKSSEHPLSFYIIASYTFSVHLSTFLLFLFQNGYATPFQTSSTTSQIHISEEPWCPHDWYSCMNVSCTFVLTNRGPHIYWLEDFCWKSSLKMKRINYSFSCRSKPNQFRSSSKLKLSYF